MKLTLARSGWLALVAAIFSLATAGTTFAANYTWTAGGGNNNWFTSNGGSTMSNNWTPSGSTIGTSDNLFYNNTGSARLFPIQNGSPTVNSVQFSGGSTYDIRTRANGDNLTVGGSIANSSSVMQTFSGVAGASGGSITFTSGGTIDTGAAGLTINRDLTGGGNLSKIGSGALVLGKNSTFSGTMTVLQGTVQSSQGFDGAIVMTATSPVTVNISGDVGGRLTQGSGTAIIGGDVLAANFSGGLLTIDGQVSGTYTQTGGFATIDTLNDFSSLTSGTLSIGTRAVQTFTQNGGVLNGGTGIGATLTEGFIQNAGDAIVSRAKTITQTTGTITFDGAVIGANATGPNTLNGEIIVGTGTALDNVRFANATTLGSANNLNLDFNEVDSDSITVNTSLALGGNLSLNFTGSGTTANYETWNFYNIVAPGTVSGSFVSLSPLGGNSPYAGLTWLRGTASGGYDTGYGDTWVSSWTGGSQRFLFNETTGVLTVVPEPSTIVFAGIGAAMLGWHTWTRGRRKARMQLIEEHMRKAGEQRGLV